MAYPPLIPEMSVALSLTHTEAGMLMSGFWAGYLAMQFPAGFLSDKIGAKRVYTVFLVFVGFLCLLTGFAKSFADCLVYRFVNGLAAGSVYAPGSALVLRWFPPKDRGVAIGFFMTGASIGTVIALAFSAAVSSIFGSWRWSFWFFGIPALFVAMLSLFFLKEKPDPGFEYDKVGRGGGKVSYGVVFKDLRFWVLCFASLGGSAVYVGSLTWIPTYLTMSVNLTEVYAGSISSLIALTGVVATPLGGFVADRILKKRSPIIFVGTFTSGVAAILFSIVMPTSLYSSVALFAIMLFFATLWFITSSLLPEWFQLEVMGTASGFLNLMSMIGAVLGPFIFGFILDLTSSFSLGWFALGCIATFLSLPMLWVMRKELGKR